MKILAIVVHRFNSIINWLYVSFKETICMVVKIRSLEIQQNHSVRHTRTHAHTHTHTHTHTHKSDMGAEAHGTENNICRRHTTINFIWSPSVERCFGHYMLQSQAN